MDFRIFLSPRRRCCEEVTVCYLNGDGNAKRVKNYALISVHKQRTSIPVMLVLQGSSSQPRRSWGREFCVWDAVVESAHALVHMLLGVRAWMSLWSCKASGPIVSFARVWTLLSGLWVLLMSVCPPGYDAGGIEGADPACDRGAGVPSVGSPRDAHATLGGRLHFQ